MSLLGSAQVAVEALQQWVRVDPGVAILHGEAGVGKRSVSQKLAGDDVRVIRATPPHTAEALLANLARQVGVTPGDISKTIESIRLQARESQSAGYHFLWVIERADLLDPKAFALITRLGAPQNGGQGLAILLLSEVSVRTQLNALAPEGSFITEIHLLPLAREETDTLIERQLRAAPWSGEVLSEDEREQIYSLSRGVPGEVIALVEQRRAGMPLVAKSANRGRLISILFATLALVALAGAGYYAYSLYGAEDEVAIEAPLPEVPTPEPEPEPVVEPPQPPALEALAALEQEIEPEVTEPPEPELADPIVLPGAASAPEPVINLDEPVVESVASAAEPVVDVAAEDAISLEADVVDVSSAPEIVLEVDSVDVADEAEIVLEIDATAESETAIDEAINPEPVLEELAPATPGFANDEALILSKAPNSFTLQLLGTRQEATARAEKQRISDRLPAAVVQLELDGQAWFVVLAGDFASRQEAQQAAEALSGEVILNGFWVRSYGSLQTAINEVWN